MKAQELIDSLPEELRVALQVMLFEESTQPGKFLSNTGFQELRNVAENVYVGRSVSKETIAAAESRLPEWIANQEVAQERRVQLIEQLLEQHPVDNPAKIPDWPFFWWGETLREPWSDRLAEAVIEAENYLANTEQESDE